MTGLTGASSSQLPCRPQIFRRCSRLQVPGLVDSYMEGKTLLDQYISHEMPFAEINQAFDLLRSGDALRTVLTFPELKEDGTA